MEPIHIFYKQLPVNEDNIFMAVITEKMRLKMSNLKKITGICSDLDCP